MSGETEQHPDYITFVEGAQLLVSEGIATSMTPQGLRYIARERTDWPFGDEPGKTPYRDAGRTRLMETGVFLRYFREVYKPKGRGPDQKPRKRPGEAS